MCQSPGGAHPPAPGSPAGTRGVLTIVDPMPSRPAQVPRLGFTLTEMVVVIGILVLLMGLAMPAMMMSMRRSDANSTQNIIAMVHQSQVRNARLNGGAGTVFGFSILYASTTSRITSKYCATSIVPWYIKNDHSTGSYVAGTIGHISATDLSQAIGGGIITGGNSTITDNSAPTPKPLVGIDFVDTVVPAVSVNFASSETAKTQKTFSSLVPKKALHVAYEPGTGFVHAIVNEIPPTPTWLATNLTNSNDTNGGILLGIIKSRGTSYTNGTYSKSLTKVSGTGTGVGAIATIVVKNGSVSDVKITTENTSGLYATGDVLTATIPGGSGFQFLVYFPTDTNLHLPEKLSSYTPNQVEIALYSIANGAAVNRVILFQNGTYAIVGP